MHSCSFKFVSAVALFLVALPVTAQCNERVWQPQKTWVVIVGVTDWQHPGLHKGTTKVGRKDTKLFDVYRQKGVPQSQISLVQDRFATRELILSELSTFLLPSNPGDLLIFHYFGHGSLHDGSVYFLSYDTTQDTAGTGVSANSVMDAIDQNFQGTYALLISDCCHSGMLAVDAGKREGRVSYATFTSVRGGEASTERWTFADCLLDGLKGEPIVDLNTDGTITLDEISRYTVDEMAFREGQLPQFSAGKGFNSNLAMSTLLKQGTLTRRTRYQIFSGGDWWPGYVSSRKDGYGFVEYAGYGPKWSEWVEDRNIQPYAPRVYQVGTAVDVLYSGKWWAATVLEARLGLHRVRYDGITPDVEHWVGPREIRVRK